MIELVADHHVVDPVVAQVDKTGTTRFRFVNKHPVLIGNFVAGQYVAKSLRMGRYELQFFVKPGSENRITNFGELMGQALEFYTTKLGLEVRSDVTLPEMGNFRWLSVGPVGQPDVAIVLMAIPGQPVMDDETGAQVRDLTAKGFAGTIFLGTDDCQASYEELSARGVEFIDKPFEQPYGIDSSFRDPFGNHFRLAQLRAMG